MKDVLDEIVAHKRVELEHLKQAVPPAMLYNEVEKMAVHPVPSMSRALIERMDHGAGQGRGYSI